MQKIIQKYRAGPVNRQEVGDYFRWYIMKRQHNWFSAIERMFSVISRKLVFVITGKPIGRSYIRNCM